MQVLPTLPFPFTCCIPPSFCQSFLFPPKPDSAAGRPSSHAPCCALRFGEAPSPKWGREQPGHKDIFAGRSSGTLDAKGNDIIFVTFFRFFTLMQFGLPMIFLVSKGTKITFLALHYPTLNPPGVQMVPFNDSLQN